MMITMATITVYREWGAAFVSRMKVFVDETLVTALRSDSAVDITTGAGRHTLRVVMGWQASAPVDVDLEAEERVQLRASVDWRAHSFTGTFRRPKEALDLEVLAGRPRLAPARTEQADMSRLSGAERLDLTRDLSASCGAPGCSW
jgi:hypothetical protein